jgi:hypothetical protein
MTTHMQQTKGAAPAAIAARNNRAASLRLSPREYLSLGRFSNAADQLGIKSTGISKGPFGQGCLLKLSGKAGQYEVHLDGNGSMILGRVEQNGKRVRLCAGNSNTEADWNRLLAVIEKGKDVTHA